MADVVMSLADVIWFTVAVAAVSTTAWGGVRFIVEEMLLVIAGHGYECVELDELESLYIENNRSKHADAMASDSSS